MLKANLASRNIENNDKNHGIFYAVNVTEENVRIINSIQIWEAGKDEVYKTICNGQFGCYDDNFVNLKQDVEEKIREYIGEFDTEIKRCEEKASECSIAEDIAKYII